MGTAARGETLQLEEDIWQGRRTMECWMLINRKTLHQEKMPSLSLFFTTFLQLLKFWPLLELLLDNHPKIKKKQHYLPKKDLLPLSTTANHQDEHHQVPHDELFPGYLLVRRHCTSSMTVPEHDNVKICEPRYSADLVTIQAFMNKTCVNEN